MLDSSRVVSCYDGERLRVLGEEEGLDRYRTLCADSRHHLWAGGFGLQQYEGGRFRKIEMGEGQEHILVSALAASGEGALFLGRWKRGSTQQKTLESPLQITRYEGQEFQPLVTREKIHGNTYISALVPTRQGELWFGLGTAYNVGPGEGLGHWREGEGVRYYSVADGLVDNRVTDLIEDQRGHLWITTHNGVSCFDGTGFRNYTTADGLPSNRVRSVCADRQGRVWFGTEGGVALYDGHVFQTLRVPEIPSVNDILQDRQGSFWFATIRGAVHYTPAVIPPKVRLLQILADRIYLPGEEIQLFTSTRQVIFEYKGLSFRTSPRDMLYTYRLQGHEEEWQRPTREMRAFYRDLPIGEYTFEVRAIDRDLNYSEPAEVHLKVVPDSRDARIDELEQRVQERTWELEEKNRALVVEAALERVRGRALGMQRGEDLQQVSAALFQEFEGLGVPLLRSSIVIVDEAKDTFEAWPTRKSPEGLPVLRSLLREVLARLPFFQKRWEARKQQRPFLVSEQTREEVIEHLHISFEVFKTPAQFHEAMRRAVPERQVEHTVFFPHGWLIFLTTDQLPEEVLAIACRFADAFNFTYTRFLDLQQAEARAREAQVEAALERVRGKALGMQQSEDLAGVAAAVFHELGNLGFHLWRCGVGTIHEESDPPVTKVWLTTTEGKAIQTAGKVPLLGHPAWEALYAAWKREDAHYSMDLANEDLTSFTRYNIEHMPPEWRSWSGDALPTRLIYYDAFFSQGYLFASVLAPLSQEELSVFLGVLQRFAGVFSLAYTRFLDLQQAEARTRQASRQAAVDRVRAEITSMRTSADLERVTPLLRKELTGLSVPFSRCGVFIVDETVQLVNAYLTNPRGVPLATLSLPFDSHDHIRDIVDHWRGREIYSKQRDQQEFLRWTDFLQGQGHIERERYLDAGAPPETLTAQFVPFTYGMLYVGSAAPLPEEDVALVKDLASAFSIAYARYLDFQQLEEQNRALEQANIQVQEANRLKSQFLANMSHDLRTPMNAIIGYTRILLRKAKDTLDERQYHNLENIEVSAQHLLFLINDILDLSKVEAGRIELQIEPVNLKKLVAECAAAMEPLLQPGVALRQQLEDLPPLRTDTDRLRRVLMNLLSNAVKFTEAGSITVSLNSVDDWVELSVADTGVGIPAEDQPYIFEEFRQSGRRGEGEKQGSGLGLTIAKKSVELLGGSIAVESQLGKGTKFILRIRDYVSR